MLEIGKRDSGESIDIRTHGNSAAGCEVYELQACAPGENELNNNKYRRWQAINNEALVHAKVL